MEQNTQTMPTIIIGLAGEIGASKHTVAEYLIQKHGWRGIAFADVLKETAQILYDFSDEQVYGKEKEIVDLRWNVSPQQVMQWISTDVLQKQFDKEFFVKRLLIKIEKLMLDVDLPGIVVTDVQFDNEAALIHQLGGCVFYMMREDNLTRDDAYHGLKKHLIDVYIKNKSTIQSLHDELEQILPLL